MLVMSYMNNRDHHRSLLSHAQRITPRTAPRMAAIVEESVARLQAGDVQVFVTPQHALNAYTFGLLPPKVVVLYATLFDVMDADEMRFVLGHELGHVRLGHTWLNSLVGGMAGIPSPYLASTLLAMAFLWWNRACEYSGDRAGLLACGKPHKAVSALVKLAAGPGVRTHTDLQRALRRIEAEGDSAIDAFGEMLATHPRMARRIEKLRAYAASPQYRRLQARVDGNVTG